MAEVSHPVEVADAFETFYQNLYDAPDEAENVAKLRGIFQYVNLSKLTETEAKQLTAPDLESEIRETIKCLKNNKSTGTDGFPCKVFKTFMDKLTPKLCEVFNYASDKNDPPKSWVGQEIPPSFDASQP